MKRSKLLLLVSAIAFLLSQVYLWVEMPRLEKAPPRTRATKSQSTKSSEPLVGSTDGRLRVDLLSRKSAAFSGVKRDLFTGAGIVTRPPEKVVPPPPSEVVKLPDPVPEPIVEDVVVAPVAEVVRTQLAQFTFLGYLKKGYQKSIFLTESGTIFVVKQDDVFGSEDQFKVRSINVDKMTISVVDSGETINVSLVEQAPLSLSLTPSSRTQNAPTDSLREEDIERPLPRKARRRMTNDRRNARPVDVSEPEMPPHELPPMPPGTEIPPMPPGTEIPPSWHNSSRGIPHE